MMNMSFFQALEQTQAMLKDVAPVVATYYKALVDSGVDKESAAKITAEMQMILFGKSK